METFRTSLKLPVQSLVSRFENLSLWEVLSLPLRWLYSGSFFGKGIWQPLVDTNQHSLVKGRAICDQVAGLSQHRLKNQFNLHAQYAGIWEKHFTKSTGYTLWATLCYSQVWGFAIISIDFTAHGWWMKPHTVIERNCQHLTFLYLCPLSHKVKCANYIGAAKVKKYWENNPMENKCLWTELKTPKVYLNTTNTCHGP